ncbi:hypothetical protein G4B88_008260 [Cannabis sativa]|uniref:SET domain-containing protein n=1 Tax=Cannabis sativa TaxID=3483 RepID=A0A7J6FLN9_CANSA|nr:hypothetical protein G4B88_008260 [Cannabis sativa]
MAATTTTRRFRSFKRWLKSKGINFIDALQIYDCPLQGISVRTLCDLTLGDVVATIPKQACLTVETSGARDLIEAYSLNDGDTLGLAVAIMYERSLGQSSPWAPYFSVTPYQEESLPLVWTSDEAVKDDQALIREDWEERIQPLLKMESSKLDPSFFRVEDYFAAKTIIHSRSFWAGDFHGYGMIPLVDLFNHKTAAEDVHLVGVSYSSSDSDSNSDSDSEVDSNQVKDFTYAYNKNSDNSKMEITPELDDEFGDMKMIMVKHVKAGSEVYNTYGYIGNGRLLHKFGFTEPNNPYDIVNIDMEIVLEWSSWLFSSRHTRARVSLWKKLGFSGCECDTLVGSDYFEISFDGEPQIELRTLLYIILLPRNAYDKLDFVVRVDSIGMEGQGLFLLKVITKPSNNTFVNKIVGDALLTIANIRESIYGLNSLEDDIEALEKCCRVRDKKLYHSLALRISERRILQKLRGYAGMESPIRSSMAATTSTTTTTRRVRSFKRWLKSKGINFNDALQICDRPLQGISVRTLCDLTVGDVVATIPKLACLTVRTSGARDLIEAYSLNDGDTLGLAVAIMYERSLGHSSPWAPYFSVTPYQEESLPLAVKEDRALLREDWEERIQPLLKMESLKLDPNFFRVEDYFAAKTIIHSRSFLVDDDSQGYGMVPLVDLFNHKTAAEDVHLVGFSYSDSDSDSDSDSNPESDSEAESEVDSNQVNDFTYAYNKNSDNSKMELEDDDEFGAMKMTMVKDVKAGSEVYNTYGYIGNATLLHKFGFTEPNNPYDIVNIDMEIVVEWSSSLFSSRRARARASMWKNLGFSFPWCKCQPLEGSNYFEISFDGEPQIELRTLLYIILLPMHTYNALEFVVSACVDSVGVLKKRKGMFLLKGMTEPSNDKFVNKNVSDALLSIADIRESLYGSNSLEDDIEALEKCCRVRDKKLYHSLALRISERRILQKLRSYAVAEAAHLRTGMERPSFEYSQSSMAAAAITTSRRVRAFKRWMKSKGVDFSDSLQFHDCPLQGISIRALCDLTVGDVVATIPKLACLTVRNTGARDLIEASSLDGTLALSVAIMYERSLGQLSPWAPYFSVMPYQESLPLVWTSEEVDSLLCGTELHKTVKEDQALICEDWEESIKPLLEMESFQLDPTFFCVQDYFAAKTLIASRSFMIDDFHGSGMVPLADLFNHKTGAEDVHFTSVSSHSESDSEADIDQMNGDTYDDNDSDDSEIEISPLGTKSSGESSSELGDEPSAMEMIMVKDVKAGSEVYNTYGSLGNAALLHRYGFTEPNNPYDIVNIDMEIVLEWSSSLFSSRHTRARVSLWKKLGFSGCDSQEESDYFEISLDGEPQIELRILLHIILLLEDTYYELDSAVSTCVNSVGEFKEGKGMFLLKGITKPSNDMFMNKSVGDALLSVANIRESLYGSNSLEDDIEALEKCCCVRDKKLYHSLALRISERRILQKLRSYAAEAAHLRIGKRTSARKKSKRT